MDAIWVYIYVECGIVQSVYATSEDIRVIIEDRDGVCSDVSLILDENVKVEIVTPEKIVEMIRQVKADAQGEICGCGDHYYDNHPSGKCPGCRGWPAQDVVEGERDD